MGGQPGKPKPIGNPPIRYEPQRPPIEEPPSRFRRRPWRGHRYQWPCDRRPKIEKPGSADRRGGLEVVGNPTAFFMQ